VVTSSCWTRRRAGCGRAGCGGAPTVQRYDQSGPGPPGNVPPPGRPLTSDRPLTFGRRDAILPLGSPS